ncbi:MAG: sugar phosphate nucleotidyltransferase [Raoultibacter sp.]
MSNASLNKVSTTAEPIETIPVVIMAGGKGTRLDPYTRILPKPLIPIGNLPIIEHIINSFHAYGLRSYHIIVNYKKQLIRAYFAEQQNAQHITFYDEEEPLNTGGGLSLLKGRIETTFFLTNCDVVIKENYQDILKFHQDHRNVITIICAKKEIVIPYGVIELDETSAVTSMQEKPSFSFTTNTGVYVVEPSVLNTIQDGVAISFPDIIDQQRACGKRVGAYIVNEEQWFDMGQMNELEAMQRTFVAEPDKKA